MPESVHRDCQNVQHQVLHRSRPRAEARGFCYSALMATTDEVQKLAELSRIKIEGAELEKFTNEFDAILAYVGQLEKLDLPQGDALREKPALRNVLREDGEPHEAGKYTQMLVEQFHAKEGNALSVKQIISHD